MDFRPQLYFSISWRFAYEWMDHNIRLHAAGKFGLNDHEMNERHHLTFDTYEAANSVSMNILTDSFLSETFFLAGRFQEGSCMINRRRFPR